jgi:dihydroflavonol-4-reductase
MIVVTGAAGHVGANLVPALLARGRKVRVLVHADRRAFQGLDVEVIQGDIRDPESLVDAFKNAEVVYHLAARISIFQHDWPLLEAVNVTGTRNVVEACLRCGVRRLVHFSTIHSIARSTGEGTVDELESLVESRRYPAYDRSKAVAEKEVRHGVERGLDAVIISPTGIIGPNDYKPSHFGDALLRLANGRLPSLVSGGFDWVDVRDVADAALSAETKGAPGEQYLISGHWVPLGEMAKTIDGIQKKKSMWMLSPLWLAAIGAPFAEAVSRLLGKEPLYTAVSIATLKNSHKTISREKASRAFGYSPRPFEETIRDTIAWYRENGFLSTALPARRP